MYYGNDKSQSKDAKELAKRLVNSYKNLVAVVYGHIHDTWDSRKSSFGDYYKVNRYYRKKKINQ